MAPKPEQREVVQHEHKASQHTPSRIEEGVCCDLSRRELNPMTRSDETASLIYHQRANRCPSMDYFTADPQCKSDTIENGRVEQKYRLEPCKFAIQKRIGVIEEERDLLNEKNRVHRAS